MNGRPELCGVSDPKAGTSQIFVGQAHRLPGQLEARRLPYNQIVG
ncbi:MAG: hypothetical protein WAN04_13005 [Candidatus Udaeobacter sp.]